MRFADTKLSAELGYYLEEIKRRKENERFEKVYAQGVAAMKSAKADEEIALAKNALKTLGGKIVDKKTFTLADGGERTIILIKKVSQIPSKYPRPSAQIAKKPL